jgi:hypothetical protein
MKLSYIFPTLVFALLTNITLAQVDYGNFEKSSWEDLSFEGRFQKHQTELNAINEYLKNHAPEPKDLVGLHGGNLLAFIAKAEEQKQYLDHNFIMCEDIRLTPDRIEMLSPEKKELYYYHLSEMQNSFGVSPEEYAIAFTELSELEGLLSYDLFKSASLLRNYLNLASDITYTKLEMFRDFTGMCDPLDYIENMNSRCYLCLDVCERGLKGTEAINWLLQHTNCDGFQPLQENQNPSLENAVNSVDLLDQAHILSAQPNPFNNYVQLQFFNPNPAFITIDIYTASGQKVKTLAAQNFDKGEYVLQWDGSYADGSKSATGVYFCILQTKDGQVHTLRLVRL